MTSVYTLVTIRDTLKWFSTFANFSSVQALLIDFVVFNRFNICYFKADKWIRNIIKYLIRFFSCVIKVTVL